MKDIVIGEGDLHGKGVYAARSFRKDEIVIKYRLRPLTEDESNNLPEGEKDFVHIQEGVKYLYSSPERFVNHSSTPNTCQDYERQADIASRDIQEGEMITTDSTKDDVQ